MEKTLKEILDEILDEIEQELDEATTTAGVDGYQTPFAFGAGRKKDKRKEKDVATQAGYSIVESINEAIKGRNNKTGESFGMVIGSDKQGNNGYELTVRKMYNSRISAYGFIFDKDSNLTDIRDYGYSLDGKFPDMKGHASSTSVRPNKRETITQIAKITSPAFAKKIYQHVQKNNKMNEGKKRFKRQDGIGKAKYTISYHDGKKKHKDGSDFFDIKIFKNKKDLSDFVGSLVKQGYKATNESVNEGISVSDERHFGKKGIIIMIDDNGKKVSAIFKDKKNADKFNRNNPSDIKKLLQLAKSKKFPQSIDESINEAKIKRPVNRWLELKNDETMHPHKKMAMGLKELKYQLREVEKFFNWYNKIKTMNELDSQNYWKRTNNHIYTIKEKLINIAKTIQEIEK